MPAAGPEVDADKRAREARAGPASSRETLELVIEAERLRLLQALAVLRCLYELLLYRDDEDSVVHAETVDVALSLVSDSIDRLDGVRLRPLVEAVRRSAPVTRDSSAPHDRVEEAQSRYLC